MVGCYCLFVCGVEMKKELFSAVERGDIQSVTRLLEMGGDVNMRDDRGVRVVRYNHVCVFDVEMNCTIEFHSSDASL